VALRFLISLVLLLQDPEPKDILRDAAAAYQSGDLTAAVRLYREFLKDHPDAAEIRSNLGAALAGDGKFAEAIEEYQTALKGIPNNPRVRMNLALAYYKVGRLPDAVKDMEVLHTIQPLELKPALLLADCLMQMGQPQKAADVLTPLQQEYPDDHAVTYLLGMALLKQNRADDAKVMLDRILRDGDSAEAAFLLGQSEFIRQNPVAAVADLKRAVELNPKLPGAHSLYGQALRSAGKQDEAIEQFHEELKVNPYDFVANMEESMLLKQNGEFDQALVHVTRALQVRPGDPGLLYQRASIYLSQGYWDGARQQLEELTRSYPDFAEAHSALATVYYKLKRKEDGDREREAARR
jgi:tetratricopeptide (TPR) repeat protein